MTAADTAGARDLLADLYGRALVSAHIAASNGDTSDVFAKHGMMIACRQVWHLLGERGEEYEPDDRYVALFEAMEDLSESDHDDVSEVSFA